MVHLENVGHRLGKETLRVVSEICDVFEVQVYTAVVGVEHAEYDAGYVLCGQSRCVP